MKAQELRDKLAAYRSFTVLIDGKQIEKATVDISEQKIYLSTKGSAPREEAKSVT